MFGFSLIGQVRTYSEMLVKISIWTGLTSIVLSVIARSQLAWFDSMLGHLDARFDVLPEEIRNVPAGYFLVFIVSLIVSRFFKLHDRLSDLLRIRARFDVDAILRPMALMTLQSPMTREQLKRLGTQRDALMHDLFYPYASTDPTKRQIDAHYVEVAIDHWTWYWVFLESAFLCVFAAVIFLASAEWQGGALLLVAVGTLALALQLLRRMCERNALNEVEEILREPSRAEKIRGRLSAL